MGASGAGKTTLLNVLNFRYLNKFKISADIKINGKLISENDLNSMSAYIQQDDLFISTLTVKEHLTFLVGFILSILYFASILEIIVIFKLKAMLKMGSKYSMKEKRLRVDEVLEEVMNFF